MMPPMLPGKDVVFPLQPFMLPLDRVQATILFAFLLPQVTECTRRFRLELRERLPKEAHRGDRPACSIFPLLLPPLDLPDVGRCILRVHVKCTGLCFPYQASPPPHDAPVPSESERCELSPAPRVFSPSSVERPALPPSSGASRKPSLRPILFSE